MEALDIVDHDLQESINRSVEKENGKVIGYDSKVRLKCAQNYKDRDCGFDEVLSYSDYHKIEDAMQAVTTLAPFAIGATAVANNDFKYHICILKDNGTFESIGNIHEINVEKLLQICDQSLCCDVIINSPSVRKEAEEIISDHIKITSKYIVDCQEHKYYDSSERNMFLVFEIEQCLIYNFLGNERCDVHLVFHKLSVYSENSPFKPHSYTPTHDPALFIGTVVVCLPSEHAGGDLVVRNQGETMRFNFADKSTNKKDFQFAAFYGDCEHEMLPVTSGHQITLTFSILRNFRRFNRDNEEIAAGVQQFVQRDGRASGPLNKDEAILAAQDAAYALVQRRMEMPYFGLFLGHCYPESDLTAECLKGADRLFYDYFVSKGIPLSLTPVLTDLDYFKLNYLKEGYIGKRDDLNIGRFAVRTVPLMSDLRRKEHKYLPPDMPFLSPWGHVGETLKNEVDCVDNGDSWDEMQFFSVKRMCLKSAMIVGPIPDIPAEGRVTAAVKDISVVYRNDRRREQRKYKPMTFFIRDCDIVSSDSDSDDGNDHAVSEGN